jgi:hypothetical protein
MSPVSSYQPKANGHSRSVAAADVILSKKMQLMEQEQDQANGFHNNNNNNSQDCEEFHDTHTLNVHSQPGNKRCPPSSSRDNDDEPIVIFDTQNNTSISRTAKDQFAAALLRLQSGLDASSRRLDEIETKVNNLSKQQRQQANKAGSDTKRGAGAGSWALTLLGNGRLGALLYLSWPVFVFLAMRALERRAALKKLV